MKTWEIAVRAKRFELAERSRKTDDLRGMVRDCETMAADLDRQIHAEEERTGVRDPEHFSYSTFAKAATLRRDKLLVSVSDLNQQLEVALLAQQATHEALVALEADDVRHGRGSLSKHERNGVAYG
jgi:flagellar protein FliJ